MEIHYSSVRNVQIVLYLLKKHGIKKVIASPGTQNMALVASMQQDPFFEMYSAADERSAAYMACGLAEQSGEPVALSCTGATASRNYISGLTEAYYRHLPVVAITSTERITAVGHNMAQIIDRSVIQNDIAKVSVLARAVDTDDDAWDCMIQVNIALLELNHHGKGPVHINLEKVDNNDLSVEVLPPCRVINRICLDDCFPVLKKGRIAVFVGSHLPFTKENTELIDRFCSLYNAVVFCDQTSNYKGKYRVLPALPASQIWNDSEMFNIDLLIQLGDVSGEYYEQGKLCNHVKDVWRVSEDGEVKDQFKKLTCVFEMKENAFFSYYAENRDVPGDDSFLNLCKHEYDNVYKIIPELPFGNLWATMMMSKELPENSILHFGILNSLRCWNFFEVPNSVTSFSNVGGFGIDGCVSSLIGSSLASPQKLHFGFFGDLAFFYDMNVLGNRHVGANVRIMLVNNSVGSEFKLFHHPASKLGMDANKFIAAGGHYGNKSKDLVRHYAEDLGFEYITASNKDEFLDIYKYFLSSEKRERPVLFEVFSDEQNESNALESLNNLVMSKENQRKDKIKKLIGEDKAHAILRFVNKIRG